MDWATAEALEIAGRLPRYRVVDRTSAKGAEGAAKLTLRSAKCPAELALITRPEAVC